MAQLTARSQPLRRSPVDVAIDRVWRFFCSVRAAIYEIAILAILVLIGTLQGSSVPFHIGEAVPALQPVVDRWYAWDVFHSIPFMAILAILATAITICTLNRAPSIWTSIAEPTVTTTRSFLTNADHSALISANASTDELESSITGGLRGQGYRVLSERRGDELHLYADKNRFAKLGTFPFHLALILILVGGLVGARFGFREREFIVSEGAVSQLAPRPEWSMRLDRFEHQYFEDGTPRMYRSTVTLLENGDPVESGPITLNNPMNHDGVNFYQSGFGNAVRLEVTDTNGAMLFAGAVPIGLYQSAKNPDAPAGVLDLPQATATLHLIARDANPVSQPELDDLRLGTGQLFVEGRDRRPGSSAEPASGVVALGQSLPLGDLQVRFVRETNYAVLQVGYNPGIPIFFVAAFLLVGGLAVTFYFPYRRVRGIIDATVGGGRTTATLIPLARRDWSGQRDFWRLVDNLKRIDGLQIVTKDSTSLQPVVGIAPAD